MKWPPAPIAMPNLDKGVQAFAWLFSSRTNPTGEFLNSLLFRAILVFSGTGKAKSIRDDHADTGATPIAA